MRRSKPSETHKWPALPKDLPNAVTVFRLKLQFGGSLEIVSTIGMPGVILFVDDGGNAMALDTTDEETNAFGLALLGTLRTDLTMATIT